MIRLKKTFKTYTSLALAMAIALPVSVYAAETETSSPILSEISLNETKSLDIKVNMALS